MRIIKHGLLSDWPAYTVTCSHCEAMVELERQDLWRGWYGSMDDGRSVAYWRCPDCNETHHFDIEPSRLPLLPEDPPRLA